MSKKIRWGILGTGRIARAFAEGVSNAKKCQTPRNRFEDEGIC